MEKLHLYNPKQNAGIFIVYKNGQGKGRSTHLVEGSRRNGYALLSAAQCPMFLHTIKKLLESQINRLAQ